MVNISQLSHQVLREVNNPNIALDMTCGNGYDTLFLARQAKKVFAFDIQDLAIENTKQLLEENNINNVKLIKESHDLFDIYVNQRIDQVIYNLGYLPKGDKQIKTKANIVLTSLKKAINLLSVNGIIVLVIYLHDLEESQLIEAYVSTLNHHFDVMKIQLLNKIDAPYIIKIQKK